MSALDRIAAEALELDDRDRVALVLRLLDSLEDGRDEDADEAWRVEVEKRVDEADRDPSTSVSWDEVNRRLFGGPEQPAH